MKLIKLIEKEKNGAWYEDEYGAEVWVPTEKPLTDE
tara:strand:- start:578 stop:685 length:108 start_codon:yes stop_codon:yes gene_type:complete